MLMATARGILRSRCQESGTLGELLSHLNELLVADTGGERFMTMLLLVIDAQQRQVRWASAGHDPPLIYNPATDAFLEPEGGGLALGVIEGEDYEERVLADQPAGQLYFASTDGLWESANAAGEQFGKERLRDILRASSRLPAEEISDRIRQALERFCGPRSPEDDVTFVVAKLQ